MYCPNCGYGNQDGAVRCRRCGQPLPTQRQSQNRYRRAEEPPHAPRPRRDYDDYDRQMRRTVKRDERSRRDERDERGGSGSSKTGTVILTILLILFLAAAIGAAAWYFFIREKSGSPAPAVVTVDNGAVQTGTGAQAASQTAGSPVEVIQDTPAAQVQTQPQPTSAPQTSSENTVHAFASPVALFDTDTYSMTASGYTSYGTNGYGLEVTFTNKTGADVYFGFNQPALNDVASNIQRSFRCAAGSTSTQILQLGNAAGDAASVSRVTLPLVVYAADGNEFSLPSDMIESGSYLLYTTPAITLN